MALRVTCSCARRASASNSKQAATVHELRPNQPDKTCEQHHHHCHFHHRASCFTSIDLPAHYSCSTGCHPSIDPLRRRAPPPSTTPPPPASVLLLSASTAPSAAATRAFALHLHVIAGRHLHPCETAAPNTLCTCRARLGLMYKRRRLRRPEPPPT